MPCFSRINTNIKNRDYLLDALRQLGAEIMTTGEKVRGYWDGGYYLDFVKNGEYYTAQGNRDLLKDVQKKYSEVGVRTWAKKRGWTVVKNKDHLVLRSYS